jgi:hypothetical protein
MDTHNPLYYWITESTRNFRDPKTGQTIEKSIQHLLNTQEPITHEHILYRGHSANRDYILSDSWFSTSSDEMRVRRQHISNGKECCLFKIHVLSGIKILQVDKYITTNYDEKEIIVNGGGVFYKTKDGLEKGFTNIGLQKGIHVYETWYDLPRKNTRIFINTNKLLNRFSENEYNFINSANNIKKSVLLLPHEYTTNNVYSTLFNKIKTAKSKNKNKNKHKNKNKTGGRRLRHNSTKKQ